MDRGVRGKLNNQLEARKERGTERGKWSLGNWKGLVGVRKPQQSLLERRGRGRFCLTKCVHIIALSSSPLQRHCYLHLAL